MGTIRRQLLLHLTAYSYKELPPGQEFTLASGRKSNFFIDCKRSLIDGPGAQLAGIAMFDRLYDFRVPPEGVAGVVLGGCPLVDAVLRVATSVGSQQLRGFYVRKEKKDHGTEQLIEGRWLRAGMSIVLLEDVITTGGSSLKTVDVLRAAEIDVLGILALVDREEGGAEAIRQAGLQLVSIFKRSDFPSGAG